MNGSQLAQLIVAPAATILQLELSPVDNIAALPAMLTLDRLGTSRTINGTEWLISSTDGLD